MVSGCQMEKCFIWKLPDLKELCLWILVKLKGDGSFSFKQVASRIS